MQAFRTIGATIALLTLVVAVQAQQPAAPTVNVIPAEPYAR